MISPLLYHRVSDLVQDLRDAVEDRYAQVTVEGEISNLARPASGHIYFTLKDTKAQLRCAWFRAGRAAAALDEPGARVRVHGRISIYPQRGDLQLIATAVEPIGAGDLHQKFEQLRLKLAAEGLFDEARKRPLPPFPKRIGIVTSSSGAAIQDICATFARRHPLATLIIAPTLVQGDGAAANIVTALIQLDRLTNIDAIIVARGGGSLEDLWPFNEESVARAIAAATTPVVSGVGHESDTTLSDFVADRRATTPTAAAETLSPDLDAMAHGIERLRRRLQRDATRELDDHRQRLDHLATRLSDPRQKLAHYREQFQISRQRLNRAVLSDFGHHRQRHRDARLRLRAVPIATRIERQRQALDSLQSQLKRLPRQALQQQRQQLSALLQRLTALGPSQTLSRGFAIVHDDAGRPLMSVRQITAGQSLAIELQDGHIDSQVIAVQPIDAG
ncbi:exodeoxyribonuclease VII large subunit [Gammaproteobacteria bacterium]|nr:exodeoxyribonuclease VII large subunit [Gammaproteobacteria bacterium]